MGARLEIITASVWNYAAVDDVNLSDTPSAKPRFKKQMVENAIRSYLNVPNTSAKPAHAKAARYRTSIRCMSEPQ